MTEPTIRELVDAAVGAMNALVVRTIVQPTNVTLSETMRTAILDADRIINHVQDAFDWVKDPGDEAYWKPPSLTGGT